jgi:hypothetical protein
LGTIVVAFISQGVFNFAINNFLYPKHSVIETNFVLPPNQVYPYCVIFQQNDEYSIKVSTDGTPINLHILPESAYTSHIENGTLMSKETEQRIINGNFPHKPSQPGQYRILVDNRVGLELPQYVNKSVIVNLTIEANRICAT